MNKRIIGWTIVAGAAATLIGCATAPSDAETSAKAAQMLKASFAAKGQAGIDRLDQDETQRECTTYSGKPLPKDVAEKIEKANFASIKWPADGKYVGDWKNGEKIAQEGRGKQYSDDPAGPVGGNCYACHQLAPQEVSFGTIGPPLYQFGKIRGYNDDMRKYAYGKIWNAEAYNACSLMPRFGHSQILTEAQVKDVVALLMDPDSPVNK
jgi:sulfur-oxidizing protein SoxX